MTVLPLRVVGPSAGLPMPSGRWHGRMWVSDRPLTEGERFRRCLAAFGETGLWPLLIPPDPRFDPGGQDWIDDRGQLAPVADRVGEVDVAALLADRWGGPCCAGQCLEPFGTEFPGLARRTTRRMDPLGEASAIGGAFAGGGGHRLALVRTARPADVPAQLGWTGMGSRPEDVAALSAVLRSWEERFGAVLFSLGFDELRLAVSAPPTNLNRALTVAAEQRAFCPRAFTGQPGSLRAFAKGLIDRAVWTFWWG